MDHFAGLDVSVKETSVCIVDDTGRIVREAKVASEPEALLTVLKNPAYHIKRIGLEAGPLSQWLYSALAEADLPVICVETRHMRAVLKAQINKTDRNDARGIAQMMRVGLYRPVHVKTLRSQKLRMLLTHRKLLQAKAIALENDLRNFGLKVGMVGNVKFEGRINSARMAAASSHGPMMAPADLGRQAALRSQHSRDTAASWTARSSAPTAAVSSPLAATGPCGFGTPKPAQRSQSSQGIRDRCRAWHSVRMAVASLPRRKTTPHGCGMRQAAPRSQRSRGIQIW